MRRASLAAIAVISVHFLALAQSATPPATFAAASVKRHVGVADGSFVGRQPGGRLTATAATLRELLEFAYRVQPYQLIDGPKRMDEDRWDVAATLDTPPARVAPGAVDDTILALRALLRERFQLALRQETRQLPIYALVLNRSDRRLGPQLTKSDLDCAALIAEVIRTGAQPPPAARACGIQGRLGSIQARGAALGDLAERLSTRLQRTVVDRTGLSGPWDITLTYTPDPSQIAAGTFAPGTEPTFDPNGLSIFTAVQEQLGLKLESTRGPVELLVVERAEPARDN